MTRSKEYELLKDYIPLGYYNSRHARDICFLLNISPRELRMMVNKARKEGLPIISSEKGYFIYSGTIEDNMEAQIFSQKLRASANDMQEISDAVAWNVKLYDMGKRP